MALRGTLKDFGIADIFQLIGQQGKDGTLTLRNKDRRVLVQFCNGNIVGAEPSTRKKRDLLGSMLVRAEIITAKQLQTALAQQEETLQRLGDMLVEQGAVDPEVLRSFTRLQTTETIYSLFLWDAGTYEFEQKETSVPSDVEVIRSENALMEGFRQIDEWPGIRKRIAGYGLCFEILEDLDALDALLAATGETDDDGLGLDDAFGDFDLDGGNGSNPRLRNIGQNERIMYHLITAGRDVQKLIDLSRLGEFEACKALMALLDAAIIKISEGAGRRTASGAPTIGGIELRRVRRWGTVALRVCMTLALTTAAVLQLRSLDLKAPSWWLLRGYQDNRVQAQIARGQIQRIRAALEVWRVETGGYPKSLDAMVGDGLLQQRDLRFPWERPYYYELRSDDGYEILRPVY